MQDFSMKSIVCLDGPAIRLFSIVRTPPSLHRFIAVQFHRNSTVHSGNRTVYMCLSAAKISPAMFVIIV